VHFVDVTARIFEPSRDDENTLLPDGIIAGEATALESLRRERHNLLYVVVSRPRSYLTIYTRDPRTLPTALTRLLKPLTNELASSPPPVVHRADPLPVRNAVVALEEYLRFIHCPHQYEFAKRAGRAPREALKLYRALDLAVRSAMEALTSEPDLLCGTVWRDVMERELQHFGLHEQPTAEAIRARAMAILSNGRQFLSEGGDLARQLRMSIGPLAVEFKSDQAFEAGGHLTLRLFRVKPSNLTRIKQPLAALLDAHLTGGGTPVSIEVATLTDARITRVGTVLPKTRERYLQLASHLCEARFPPDPFEARNCMFCGYLFPCVGPEPK
jgi:hypothetical protein